MTGARRLIFLGWAGGLNGDEGDTAVPYGLSLCPSSSTSAHVPPRTGREVELRYNLSVPYLSQDTELAGDARALPHPLPLASCSKETLRGQLLPVRGEQLPVSPEQSPAARCCCCCGGASGPPFLLISHDVLPITGINSKLSPRMREEKHYLSLLSEEADNMTGEISGIIKKNKGLCTLLRQQQGCIASDSWPIPPSAVGTVP